MKFKVVILSLVLVFVTGCCHAQLRSDPQRVDLKNYFKSIVRIQLSVKNKKEEDKDVKENMFVATGFAVDEETIITARHFCGVLGDEDTDLLNINITALDKDNLPIDLKDGKIGDVLFVFFDDEVDLCALKVKDHGLRPLRIVDDASSVNTFDDVAIMGAPFGFFPVVSYGRVVNYMPPDDKFFGKLILNIVGTFGNSGGPVLNKNGEVIGVVLGKHAMYDNIMFAVSFEEIHKFLAKVDK